MSIGRVVRQSKSHSPSARTESLKVRGARTRDAKWKSFEEEDKALVSRSDFLCWSTAEQNGEGKMEMNNG